MKICFFPHYSYTNQDGATLSMYNIIEKLLERNHEVIVISPNQVTPPIDLNHKRLKYIVYNQYSMRMNLSNLKLQAKLKFAIKDLINNIRFHSIMKKLKNEKPDIIHINGIDSYIGAKCARHLKIPYVWHVRQFLEDDLGKTVYKKNLTYNFLAKADSVIAISKSVQAKFKNILHRDVDLVYNGVPIEAYVQEKEILKNNEIKLLLPGRISSKKGQLIAAKAIKYLKEKNISNLHLTIVGNIEDKSYFDELQDFIKKNELQDSVSMISHTNNMLELRKEFDIGLTCSQKEAFGRVTIENMMSNLYVIGANSAGTAEIINDGETGSLYEVDDFIDLAQKIMTCISNVSESRNIANRGLNHARTYYSINRVVDELENIYHRVR